MEYLSLLSLSAERKSGLIKFVYNQRHDDECALNYAFARSKNKNVLYFITLTSQKDS